MPIEVYESGYTNEKLSGQFPTMEFAKDPSESCGWKRLTHEQGTVHSGIEGVLTDGMGVW